MTDPDMRGMSSTSTRNAGRRPASSFEQLERAEAARRFWRAVFWLLVFCLVVCFVGFALAMHGQWKLAQDWGSVFFLGILALWMFLIPLVASAWWSWTRRVDELIALRRRGER